jgi:uncharacterized protein YybS (DUF2232 family)
MSERVRFALLFLLLAVLTIAVYAGGLGVIFMVLHETALKQWAVVILGLVLVVGVPSAAALAQSQLDEG